MDGDMNVKFTAKLTKVCRDAGQRWE